MKEKFPEFYIDFDSLWKNAVFVFDTNVILDILRMPKAERDSFIKVIEELKTTNTIWIPFQVAFEYHNHFRKTIKENEMNVTNAKHYISNEIKSIIEKIKSDYNLGLVDVDTELIKTELIKTLDSINNLFENANNSKTDYENLIIEIVSIFDNVGLGYDTNCKKAKKEDAEKRIKECIPPGFKDKKKDNGNETGDIFIWFEILDYAKKNEKDIIFITRDSKEDWFQKIDKITVMPRPELLTEFHSVTGKFIWIYTEDNFIKQYNNKITSKTSKLTSAEENKLLNFMTQTEKVLNITSMPCGYSTERNRKTTVVYKEHIDKMKDWFLENYEDPANSCPYESKEGGYIYIYGGPYDAQEELNEKFGHKYNSEEIRIAADELEDENEVYEWSGLPGDDFQN